MAKSRESGLLRARSSFDKYRIEQRISVGPFATVYRALDTIEGVRVALKIPHPYVMDHQFLDDFRREVRLLARLDHPHILHVKNAGFINGSFVIVFPLGERTLADRLQRRMSLATVMSFTGQALDALAYAHGQGVIHCDIKPENFIIFRRDHLRLADFGIARMALRTIDASGSGTIGYVAPEQAMGRPSLRSDVFSLGLVVYRMATGVLPRWPYDWPPEGYQRIRKRLHPEFVRFLQKSIEMKPGDRFRDAGHMLAVFRRIRSRTLAYGAAQTKRKAPARPAVDWNDVRHRQFVRMYGAELGTRHLCRRCGGPVSEPMRHCPWCGADRKVHRGPTRMPRQCPRCRRGLKLDWLYCPWCYGPKVGPASNRSYSDARYEYRCANPGCERKNLIAFMRYCPWCRRATHRRWAIEGSKARCTSCGWGVLPEFWDRCPWCGKPVKSK